MSCASIFWLTSGAVNGYFIEESTGVWKGPVSSHSGGHWKVERQTDSGLPGMAWYSLIAYSSDESTSFVVYSILSHIFDNDIGEGDLLCPDNYNDKWEIELISWPDVPDNPTPGIVAAGAAFDGLPHLWIGGKLTPTLLFEPNWSEPVDLSVSIDLDMEQDVSGDRVQRPRHVAPRHRMRYQAMLKGHSAAALRKLLASAGGSLRAAVPVWPDRRKGADWANRHFNAQYNAEWGADGVVSLFEGSPTSTSDAAPLVIGRLRRHAIRMLTDDVLVFDVDIEEDSPFAERMEPRPDSGSETAWDATAWPFNWRDDPEEDSTDALTEEVIGDGRLLSTGGTASTPRISNTGELWLQGAGIARFLRFWVDCMCDGNTFAFATLARPGLPIGQTNNFAEARFHPSPLLLSFTLPGLASARVRVEDATDWDDEPPVADIFEFSRNGVVFARLTSWEDDFDAGGETWKTARVKHEGIRASLDLARDAARIKLDLDDMPDLGLGSENQHGLLARLFLFETEHPVQVKILRSNPLTGSTPAVLYRGRVDSPALRQNVLTADLKQMGGYLDRLVPSWKISTTCNYAFLDAGCRLRSPSAMDPALWTTTGTLKPVEGQSRKVRLEGHSSVHAPSGITIFHTVENYWTGGRFSGGSGATGIIRLITGSEHIGGGVIELELDRPVDWDMAPVDSTAAILPGCDGSYDTCKNKFLNDAAFGGCPQLPEYIDTTAPGGPRGGK